jgi:hypothetical protein
MAATGSRRTALIERDPDLAAFSDAWPLKPAA